MLLINGPPEVRIHLSTALAVSIPFALITMFLVSLVVRARANKAVMGSDMLIDQVAEARTALTPSGTVFLQGEYWNAESDAPVEKGSEVRVVSVDGLKLHVSPVGK
jgi:membrane-bound serine protease (ClpP class)